MNTPFLRSREWIRVNGSDLMIDPEAAAPSDAQGKKKTSFMGMEIAGLLGPREDDDFYELLGAIGEPHSLNFLTRSNENVQEICVIWVVYFRFGSGVYNASSPLAPRPPPFFSIFFLCTPQAYSVRRGPRRSRRPITSRPGSSIPTRTPTTRRRTSSFKS